MSVRKRTWTTAKGEQKEAWIVDYAHNGRRLQRTFSRKKEADRFSDNMKVEVRNGIHTPDRESITVADAGKRWIDAVKLRGRERGTIELYGQYLKLHIEPYLGAVRLSRLSAPMVRDFETKLLNGTPAPGETVGSKRSLVMVRRLRTSLSSILAEAQEQGLVSRNVVRDLSSKKGSERRRAKLKAGVDFPTTEEMRAILEAAKDTRWRPLLLVAALTGLRASELRGLTWADVDLKRAEIHVTQRADRYNSIGMPKTRDSGRKVPLPSDVINELREWKLRCPIGERNLDLVFPNLIGGIESHSNVVTRGLIPIVIAAGVRDRDGKAKYTGMHTLRHFFASWCLGRRADGGRELPLKTVSEWLGHSTISMTADIYGGLLPRGDDADELTAAARALLG
jgi:integrase